MDNYNKINYLLRKYSTKQPHEKWSTESETKYKRLMRLKEKIELFDGINSEFFNMKGDSRERAVWLIKHLTFRDICGQCTSEQIIVLICYFVKCETVKGYGRNYCRKVFKAYNISDNLIDKFMVHLAHCNLYGEF